MNILLIVCPPFEGYTDLLKIVQRLHEAERGKTTALCMSTEIAQKYYSPFSIQLEGKSDREKEKKAFDEVTETLGEKDVLKMTRGGEPVSQLLAHLDENSYDLLIFGDADKEITTKISEHSTIPTLIYRGGSIENFLLCTDGSEFSIRAARFTARLAGITGGKITLLSVYKDGDMDMAREAINSTRKSLENSGFPYERIEDSMETGNPPQIILSMEKDHDIVALAPRGLHRIARALMGHVSLKVLKKADSSILLVR